MAPWPRHVPSSVFFRTAASAGCATSVSRRALDERGCKLGDMAGCNNLATLYQFGSLGFRDRGRAEALYEKACGAAHAEACTNLALLYLDDSNVSADRRVRARGLLTKACADGVSRACQKLGR